MPFRITQESYRPRVSDRTMVGALPTRSACKFQEPNGVDTIVMKHPECRPSALASPPKSGPDEVLRQPEQGLDVRENLTPPVEGEKFLLTSPSIGHSHTPGPAQPDHIIARSLPFMVAAGFQFVLANLIPAHIMEARRPTREEGMKLLLRVVPAVAVMALAQVPFPSPPLDAQERPAGPILHAVWIGADGKYEAEPDTAVVQFNISAQEDNLQAANARATRAAEQVRQLLRNNGLDSKQAQVGAFSVQPVYDYKNPKRKLVGYRVDTDITIKLKDFAKVGPIIQSLADMDVTGNQSVTYTLDDIDAAKVRAVEDALRRARDEAGAVARSSSRTLGELSYASVDTYEQPRPRPMLMNAPAAAKAEAAPAVTEEFGAQKITVTAHVNALYNLK